MHTPLLVGDIGGTHVRLALATGDAGRPRLQHVQVFEAARFASLQACVLQYLHALSPRPTDAVLAIAAAIPEQAECEVRLTNRDWCFNREQLQTALGLRRLRLINDFAAIGHALPYLAAADVLCLQGEAALPLPGVMSIIGPGTGLGVALAVADSSGGWQTIATEGGHASFATVGDEQLALTQHLAASFGRISNERVLSGAGLSHMDAFVRSDPGQLRTPAQIVTAALNSDDPSAHKALNLFCGVLGQVAGDIALIHGSRHVLLAGGLLPRFTQVLQQSPFLTRFADKGRFQARMQAMPVSLLVHPAPGLLGAAACGLCQPPSAG